MEEKTSKPKQSTYSLKDYIEKLIEIAKRADKINCDYREKNEVYQSLSVKNRQIFGQFYLAIDSYATKLAGAYIATKTKKIGGSFCKEIVKYWKSSQDYNLSKQHVDSYLIGAKTDLFMNLWVSFEGFVTFLNSKIVDDQKATLHKSKAKELEKKIRKQINKENDLEIKSSRAIIELIQKELIRMSPHSSLDKKLSPLLKGIKKEEKKDFLEFLGFLRDIRNFSHNNFISNKDKDYTIGLMNNASFAVKKNKQVDFMYEKTIISLLDNFIEVNRQIFENFLKKQKDTKLAKKDRFAVPTRQRVGMRKTEKKKKEKVSEVETEEKRRDRETQGRNVRGLLERQKLQEKNKLGKRITK